MHNAQDLYDKLKTVSIGSKYCSYSLELCNELWPIIAKIREYKERTNSIILAHSYVDPEIIYTVADYVGDSYYLSKAARDSKAENIIFVAVKFMGDTAKILSPDKRVFIPSSLNGCSLADSIDKNTLLKLKEEYKDYTFVCYINTTAEVKALCDVCVTSSNVYDIVEKIPNDKIYFLPDKLMGKNIVEEMKKRKINKDILYYTGTCYVHEEYEEDMIDFLRLKHDKMKVLAHPECSPEVLAKSDFVGSTSNLLDFINENKQEKEYLLLTECGLSSRLQVERPDVKFIGSCSMCKYMKSNTLDDILRVLKEPTKQDEILIEEETLYKAKQCIDAMFAYVE